MRDLFRRMRYCSDTVVRAPHPDTVVLNYVIVAMARRIIPIFKHKRGPKEVGKLS
jgi:hypothetical protein